MEKIVWANVTHRGRRYSGKAIGARLHYKETTNWRRWDCSGDILMGNTGSCYLCRRYFIMYHLPQHN